MDRPTQVLRRGLPHRNQHRQSRNKNPFTQTIQLEQEAKGIHTNQTIPFAEPYSQRTTWQRTHHCAVELPSATLAQPTRRGNIVGMHRHAQTLALCADSVEYHSRDDSRNLPRGVCSPCARQPRCQHRTAQRALGHHLLYRQSVVRQTSHVGCSQKPHPRSLGVRRQESVHHRSHSQHRSSCASHSLGQDPQQRSDMHCARLYPHTPRCQRAIRRSLCRRSQSPTWQRCEIRQALCAPCQRPSLRACVELYS